jgi:hypothetical protein
MVRRIFQRHGMPLTAQVENLRSVAPRLPTESFRLNALKMPSGAKRLVRVRSGPFLYASRRPPFHCALNQTATMQLTTSPSHRRSIIEPLEARIAPASVFNFTDVDGDLVTVKTSLGTLTAGNFTLVAGPVGSELQKITLDATFDNTDLAITVKPGPGPGPKGNGSVNVGYIDATGVDMKSVSIAGDLGRIDAGGGAPGPVFGVSSLTVDSLGRGGVLLQGAGGSLFTEINGNLGKLTVKGDIYRAEIRVAAEIGSITIGGSLIGGPDANTGLIFAGTGAGFSGNIGTVKIGGSILGGGGDNSGQIFAPGNIASLTIGGDVAGGTGNHSGWVFSAAGVVGDGGIGAVVVKGSILGNPQAERTDTNVGSISTVGTMKSLTVGGDIIGGAGIFGGYVQALGAMGPVKITGDVRGDSTVFAQTNAILDFAASFNGGVQSATSMGNVSVGGSVIGGIANYSGVIFVGNEDIADNQAEPGVGLVGDPGENDGINVPIATTGNMGSVTIKGSLIGGGLVSTFPNGFGGAASGWIKADGSMGAVKIGGDVIGSIAQYSGAVQARGDGLAANVSTIASVTVGGSLRGGQGYDSGSIFAGSPDILQVQAPTATALGPVKITGSLFAGFGNISGTIYSDTSVKSVSIGGSIVGDTSGTADAVQQGGGAIVSNGDIGTVAIKGGVYGEFGPLGGGIYAFGGGIKSVSIGRDFTGATSTTGIYAAGTIGSVNIGGSLAGAAPGSGVVFILSDTAISKLTVKGRVENADILAGSGYYNAIIGGPGNADAQIGSVSVGLDWIASNLAAGVDSSDANFFGFDGAQSVAGNNLNAALASRIASISIKGNVIGTPDIGVDGFGFFAQQIGSLKIRGVAQVILPIVPPATSSTTVLGDPVFSDTVLTIFAGS